MKTAFGLNIPQTLEDVCDPRRTALLVYDMQVGILSQIKNSKQITSKVLEVLTAAREAGVRVFFSRHLSLPKELMGVFQFRTAMAWQRKSSPEEINPWFLRENPGFQIVPELTPLPREGIFDKITMSAFEGTWFDIALRDCGINAFVAVGRPSRSASTQPSATALISVTFQCSSPTRAAPATKKRPDVRSRISNLSETLLLPTPKRSAEPFAASANPFRES
jgi:hypothetical protein